MTSAEEERAIRADERARLKAITSCDEAKSRGAQALILAVDTDLTVEQARALLAASPQSSSLSERMASRTPFVLDPEHPQSRGGSGAHKIDPEAIYASRRQEVGHKP